VKRITEWWRPKGGAIFSVLLFYLAFWDVPFSDGWKLLMFSLITLTGFGVTGYFLNDWADIPFDKKAGKTNLVSGVPKFARPLILIILLVITLFPWFVYFQTDYLSIGLIALQLILQFAYPVPPIRLKNYPIPAIITDALYAFAIPSILAWYTFDLTTELVNSQVDCFYFFTLGIWMLVVGVRQILNHHVSDRHNDRKTDIPNITTSYSPAVLRGFILRFLFPAEVISSVAFFSIFSLKTELLPLLIIGCLVIAAAGHIIKSPPFITVSFSQTKLDRFTSFYLGFLSLLFLITSEIQYLIIAGLFLIFFTNLSSHPLVGIAGRKSRALVLKLINAPFSLASLAFNWSLYYFRKWFLGWSEERNWGEHYPKHFEDLALAEIKNRGIVAVFNQNYGKYTETFVNGHLENLPFHIVPFHGWPSPVHVSKMENLVSDEPFLQDVFYSFSQLINTNSIQKEDNLIAQRLIADGVDLMLVEFGTVGARVVNIAKQAGIPMVVIFYGYDAWHNKTLEENKAKYLELFEEAQCVIGVSQDICKQLVKLGCSEEKVTYLPCYVNLDLFAPVEHDFSQPKFLSVGRFCNTKAPELTILAFNEVAKKIPNATLTMIGTDDGNGMFEASVSLIRALGLVDRINLLGKQSPKEVNAEMQKASIFIQHSVTAPLTGDKEGTPVAIMEAMATGLPVIATRHAGIAEVIESGVTGVLVEEYNYTDMAKEMVNLCASKERMQQMGMRAAQSIGNNDLIARHSEKLTEIISQHKA
jgi:colanic acid/amylovoran biosynthesis glycosyltransferase